MPTGREPIPKLKHDSPCQPVGPWRKAEPPRKPRASLDSAPQALTLGVGFLEGVAGVHKAGGRVVLALELQVQLGCLAEGVSGSWKRRVILA